MKLDKAAVARIKNATPKKQQKGASSLEYIMLAAVLVAILVVVANTELGITMRGFFQGLFDTAKTEAGLSGD